MLNLRQFLFKLIRFPVVLPILGISMLIIVDGCVQEDSAEKLPTSDKGTTLTSKVDRKDTVIFDLGGNVIPDPHNLNPLVPSPTGPGMNQCVWEPLFILNYETAEIESWIGESFTANQALDVWTLTIRPDVEWSDGEPFTADDIIFTINTLLADDTQSLGDSASMQQWVKRVEKVGLLKVIFYLKIPNPRFKLDYFSVRVGSSMVILPEHIWRDKDPSTFKFYDPKKGWPIGTGAYRLVSTSMNEVVFDRRDDWWGAKSGFRPLPEPKRLIWLITGVEENRALLAANSELDSLTDITLGAFESIRAQNPNIVAWKDKMPYAWLDPCPRQLSVNHTIPPWDNPKMRKAISLIIDRQQIVKIAYEDTSFPSKTIFVEYPAMKPYIDAIQDLWIDPKSNVSAGRQLIEAEGWKLGSNGYYQKSGEELSLNIQTHAAAIELRRVGDVIVEQLRSAGILATNRAITGATWQENKAFGKFEAVVDWDACGSVNEPWLSMNRYTNRFLRPVNQRSPSGNNHVRWSGSRADKYSEIVAKIGVMPLGDPEIEAMVIQAMKLFMDDQVVIPITQARKLVPFITTYWEGWPTAKNNYFHPPTWWMSTHRIIQGLRKTENSPNRK